ncbi:MAG: hypothetical protein KDB52_11170 [Solirubrobacterales bacterium]|nr:hypothetical protein [Solirubrobacterales bacterium]
MATETTTIRVPRETRDRLASQAADRGISLSAMLTRFANQGERDAVFRAEREASVLDGSNPDVLAEDDEWSATLADGLD